MGSWLSIYQTSLNVELMILGQRRFRVLSCRVNAESLSFPTKTTCRKGTFQQRPSLLMQFLHRQNSSGNSTTAIGSVASRWSFASRGSCSSFTQATSKGSNTSRSREVECHSLLTWIEELRTQSRQQDATLKSVLKANLVVYIFVITTGLSSGVSS